MTWEARFALAAIGLFLTTLLLACSARVSRLPSPPGVATYQVEFRWGVEARPEGQP